MPNALAHSIAGALAGITAASFINGPFEVKVGAGIIAFIFSFLPDLDHEKATARKCYRRVMPLALGILLFIIASHALGVGFIYSLAIAVAFALPITALSEAIIPRHRGIMHTYLFGAAISLVLLLALTALGAPYALQLALAALAGYSSHVALDKVI